MPRPPAIDVHRELRAALDEAGLSRSRAARVIAIPEGTLATLLWGARRAGELSRSRLLTWPGDGPAAQALRARCL